MTFQRITALHSAVVMLSLAAGLATLACGMPAALADGDSAATAVFYVH